MTLMSQCVCVVRPHPKKNKQCSRLLPQDSLPYTGCCQSGWLRVLLSASLLDGTSDACAAPNFCCSAYASVGKGRVAPQGCCSLSFSCTRSPTTPLTLVSSHFISTEKGQGEGKLITMVYYRALSFRTLNHNEEMRSSTLRGCQSLY